MNTEIWLIEPFAAQEVFRKVDAFAELDMAAYNSDDWKERTKYQGSLDNGVAILPVHGVMTSDRLMAWYMDGTHTQQFTEAVLAAADSPAVKAILLDMDSPGGSVNGIYEAVEAIAYARTKKPVMSSVRSMCCSANYWCASQGDGIYSSYMADNGNIGAVMKVTDTSKAMQNLGVKTHLISSGPYKGMGAAGTEITPEHLAEFQRRIDQAAAVFKEGVKKGRKMKTEALDAVSDGRSFMSPDAVKNGLIDGIAEPSAVLQAMRDYQPGRKALKVAHRDTKEKRMSETIDKFLQFLKGSEASSQDTLTEAMQSVELDTTKKLLTNAQATIASLNEAHATKDKTIEALNASVTSLETRLVDAIKAEHEAVVATLVKAGKVTPAQKDTMVSLRMQGKDVFDALMAVAKTSSPLLEGDKDVISGKKASEDTDVPAPEKKAIDELNQASIAVAKGK